MRVIILKDFEVKKGTWLRKDDTPLLTKELAAELIKSGHGKPVEEVAISITEKSKPKPKKKTTRKANK